MKKVILALVIIVLVIAGYVFVKDRQNRAELETVERAEFTESAGEQNTNPVASEIDATRKDGEWSVSETGEYTLDPSSLKVEFTGYKVGGQHIGTFNDAAVKVSLDEEGQPVNAVISLEISSVKTDTEAVDKHLQTPDFFDSASNPQVVVNIKGIERVSDTSVRAISDISMAGQTKTLAIPVTLTEVEGGVQFDVDAKIQISEYGIVYGPVLDDVRIVASGVLLKK